MTPPIERALLRVFPWVLAGSAAALPLLAVPQPSDLLAASTWHLAAVVTLGLGLTAHVVPLVEEEWFIGTALGNTARRFSAALALIAFTTGAVGLVTLATGAALRFDPSFQFLQLLSALDIAWVVTAAMIGAYRRWGRRPAWAAGVVVAAFCVWAIYRYLDIVGFAPDGGWLVDGGEIARLILPFDTIAAVVAISLLVVGTLFPHRTAQAKPKS